MNPPPFISDKYEGRARERRVDHDGAACAGHGAHGRRMAVVVLVSGQGRAWGMIYSGQDVGSGSSCDGPEKLVEQKGSRPLSSAVR